MQPEMPLDDQQDSVDDAADLSLPALPKSPSIWDKAKRTLSDVSAQASTAGGALKKNAVAVGSTSAAKTADVARGAIATSKQAYSGSKIESAVRKIDNELDQRGAKKAIKETTGAVVGKLDQVTGKRLVELLEEKLRVQDEYNDVLATRLAEALERIAKLEARFTNED